MYKRMFFLKHYLIVFYKQLLKFLLKVRQNKNLEKQLNPESIVFTIIYILCSISISLSIIFPTIRSRFRIEFIWEDMYHWDTWAVVIVHIPILFSVLVLLNSIFFNPRLRSSVLFYFFLSIAGILVLIAMLSFAIGDPIDFPELLMVILTIATPIGFFVTNVLMTKYNSSKLRKLSIFFSICVFIYLFVPIVDNESFFGFILDEGNTPFLIMPVLLTFVSTCISLIAVFCKDYREISKWNIWIIKAAIFMTPACIMIDENFLSWREFSYILKGTFAFFGIFFLICYTIIEFVTTRHRNITMAFARPIHVVDEHIVNYKHRIDETTTNTVSAEPYKSANPSDNKND